MTLRRMRAHLPQFALYVASGFTALAVDYGSYLALFRLFSVWYIAASVVGGILGFFTTFLMNKYLVFRKREDFAKHLVRFFVVDMCNIAATNAILYGLVEFAGFGEEIGKFVAMGFVVFWNFFLYKFVVYV